MNFTELHNDDLILNDEFRRWALDSSSEKPQNWESSKDANPENLNQINAAKELLLSVQPLEEKVSNEKINAGLENLIQYQEQSKAKVRKINFKRTISIAASFLILLASSAIFYSKLNSDMVVYKARKSSKEILFADNSIVILNKNSKLITRKNWDKTADREVELKGEAYFIIEKQYHNNRKLKFQVKTKDVTIEVLGTEFNVNTTNNTKVALNSGEVKIHYGWSDEFIMVPGDVTHYDPKGEKVKIVQENVQKQIQWLNNSESYTKVFKHYSKADKVQRKDIQTKFRSLGKNSKFDHIEIDKKTWNNFAKIVQDGRFNRNQTSQHGTSNFATTVSEGQKNFIEINQSGENNKVGEEKADIIKIEDVGVYQNGENNSVSIDQEGENNFVQVFQNGEDNRATSIQNGLGNQNKIAQEGQNNEAFVKQIGENVSSEIIQDGSDNKAEVEYYGKNNANNQSWTYQEQEGVANNSSIYVSGKNTNTTISNSQKGDFNNMNAYLKGEDNELNILQKGDNNTTDIEIAYGDWNWVIVNQYGSDNKIGKKAKPGIYQTGRYNSSSIIQTGQANSANTLQAGNRNKAKISQNKK